MAYRRDYLMIQSGMG